MDIEEFYDADERRRSSEEIELGLDWVDTHRVRYELSWVVDTGELYVMREPGVTGWATPFGGTHVYGQHSLDEHEIQGMGVVVVATIPTQSEMESVLSGWGDEMEKPDSIGWIIGRLRQAGLMPSAPPPGPTGAADPDGPVGN